MAGTRIDDLFEIQSVQAVEIRRVFLARSLFDLCSGIVRYGPLKGYVLDRDTMWGQGDLAAKLLGSYEQEVMQALVQKRPHYSTLVNLGAADGCYGVGTVKAGIFERSICYEASEKGRAKIASTATANGISQDVVVRGAANAGFPGELAALGVDLKHCAVLCDVEGAEFDILAPSSIEQLQHSFLVIELHDFMIENGEAKKQNLIDTLSKYFAVSTLTTQSRDLSSFPELDRFSDNDRWLMCSEGRPRRMSWLQCVPLG